VSVTFIQRSALVLAAALAGLAVVAAGLAATDGSVIVVRQPPSPPTVRSILLTTSSEGSRVDARLGELVVVRLVGRGQMRWSGIKVSQPRPVLAPSSASLSPQGTSNASYRATEVGEATLSATGTPICAPGAACPQFIELWRAFVVVGS
jgi:hypothetical protein